VGRQTAQIQRLERVISTGALGAATGRSAAGGLLGGGLLAGAGAGVGVGSLLTQGFQRFSELERLNKQFLALTQNETAAVALMEQLKQFARTTSFDLVGVADLAKGFLAMGTATEEVLPRVQTIADAVALTGGGVDELNRIQRALGQVVSAGRLQGDELNQLAENLPGLNIRKLLADQLTGGDTAALIEMQEAGELTADKFMSGLLTGLSQDQRLAGAAQDLAETVGGRFANLKEAFADLGASVIGLFADQLRLVFGALNSAFSELAQFIRGEGLSAGLETLRTAAGGAAIAIGGLVVAKVAAEALQLLGVVLRGVLTPIGLLIAGVAAVGAVIAVLRERSIPFREATDGIIERLGELASGVGGFLLDKLTAFADFLGTTVIPAIERFAVALAERVVPAAKALGDFFTTTVIPALVTFGAFIRDTVVPAVGDALGAAFDAARAAVGRFWDVAEPVLQPAIDGFLALGEAIGGIEISDALLGLGTIVAGALGGFAVGGPLGALVGGIGGIVGASFITGFNDELVGGLANLGGLVVKGLGNLGGIVQRTFGRIFTIDNILDVAGIGIELAGRLGFIIGRAVSDPRLVAAVAGLIGVGVAAAAQFAVGFGRGVIENVPELAGLLKTALGEGLKLAVSGLTDVLGSVDLLTKVVGALFIGGAALGAWRRAGTQAGAEVQRGFASSLFGGAFAGGGTGTRTARGSLLTSLFNPAGIAEQARRAEIVATTAVQKIQRGMANTLTAAGRSNVKFLDSAGIKREFDQLTTQIGPSGVFGLRVREAFRQSIRAISTGSLLPLRELSATFAATGQTLGKSLVKGMVGALGGAAIGAQVGQAVGGQSLLTQALGIGGTALAIGAISPVAGVAAGAVGILAAALSDQGKDAEEAAERTRGYVDALKGLTADARGQAVTDTVLGSLLGADEDVRRLLRGAEFDVREFGDRIVAGTTNASGEFKRLIAGMGEAGVDFTTLLLKEGAKTADDIDDLFKTRTAGREFARQLDSMGLSADTVVRTFRFLSDESGSLRDALGLLSDEGAFRDIADDADLANNKLTSWQLINDSIQDQLSQRGKTTVYEAATEALGIVAEKAQEARTRITELLSGDYRDTLTAALDSLVVGLPGLGEQIAATFGTPDAPIAASIGERLRRQLGEQVELDIRGIINVGLTTGEIKPTEGDVNALLESVRAEAQRLLDEGAISAEAFFSVNAAINEIQNSGDIPAMVQALLDAQAIPSITVNVPFLVETTVAGITVPDAQKKIIKDGIATAVGAGGGIPRGVFGESRGLPAGAGLVIPISATIDPQLTVNEAPAAAAGDKIAVALGKGIRDSKAAVAAAKAAGAAASAAVTTSTAQAFNAGVQVAAGLAAGIRAGAGAALAAAQNMANQVAAVTRSALKIKSPSRVFRGIGIEVGEGFAEGLQDAESSIVSAASGAVSRAIEAARDAIGGGRGTLAAGIFEALQISSGNARHLGLITGMSDLTQGPTRFRSANESLAEDILAAAIAHFEGQNLGSDQRALLGQSFLSLNPFEAAGARNIAAFLEEGSRIQQFIADQLTSGADVSTTVNSAAAFREQLANTLRSMRVVDTDFREDSLQSLIRSLGLADDQLAGFVNELNAAEAAAAAHTAALDAAAKAEEAAAKAAEAAEDAREAEVERLREALRRASLDSRPIEVNIHPPFGDAEAIGLGAANRVAFELAG
jgi:tape measure domain-containing protein